MVGMTTYVRADEAARILGVSKPTLYAYVSRGRVSRTIAPDGRASLFALDEIESLADAGVHGSGELRRVALAVAHRTRLRPGLPCRLCAFAFWLLSP